MKIIKNSALIAAVFFCAVTFSGHGVGGHSGSWHIGSYGPGHRMNRGERFTCWYN